MTKQNKKAFTLVELVIVIAVIAVLAAVLMPTFAGILERARESTRITRATNAVREYYSGNSEIENINELQGKVLLVDGNYYQIQQNGIVVRTTEEYALANGFSAEGAQNINGVLLLQKSNTPELAYRIYENPTSEGSEYVASVTGLATSSTDALTVVIPETINCSYGIVELNEYSYQLGQISYNYYYNEYSYEIYWPTTDSLAFDSATDFANLKSALTDALEDIYTTYGEYSLHYYTSYEDYYNNIYYVYNYSTATSSDFDTLANAMFTYDSEYNIYSDQSFSSYTYYYGPGYAYDPDGETAIDVISIDYNAFRNKTNIVSVQFPETICLISEMAFYGCTGLTSVTIENNSERIVSDWQNSTLEFYGGTFANCTNLKTVTITSDVIRFYGNDFSVKGGTSALETVIINGDVIYFGTDPFLATSSTVNEMTGEYEGGFVSTSSLKTLIINGEFRGDWVFYSNGSASYGLDKLETIHINDTTYLDDYNHLNITLSTPDDECLVINAEGLNSYYNDEENLEAYKNQYGVSGKTLLAVTKNMTSIPSDIVTIGKYCYAGQSLTSFTVPSNIENIMEGAFKDCANLATFVFSNNITKVEAHTFDGCSNLATVTLTNSIESLNAYSFANCTSLTTISIPESVTFVDLNAFCGCTNLNMHTVLLSRATSIVNALVDEEGLTTAQIEGYTIQVLNWLYTIGENKSLIPVTGNTLYTGDLLATEHVDAKVFTTLVASGFTSEFNGEFTEFTTENYSNYMNITNGVLDQFSNEYTYYDIVLPEIITTIKSFEYAKDARTVRFSNSITTIGYSSMASMHFMTTINIPDSVTTIEGHAFDNCTSLRYVTLSKNLTVLGDNSFYMTNIQTIEIPEGVEVLDSYTFGWCTSLTSITLPSTLTTIRWGALIHCTSLTQVIIPASVVSMTGQAIEQCPSLVIYCEATSKPAGWSDIWNYNNRPVYWYSATYQANCWHYVNDVPTLW